MDVIMHGNIYSFNRSPECLLCAGSVLDTVGDGKEIKDSFEESSGRKTGTQINAIQDEM